MFPGVKHWLAWLIRFSCHLQCWRGDGSFFKVTKVVKDLVIFIKGQEGVYSSLSDDSNNLHLSFQLTHWPLGDFNLILGTLEVYFKLTLVNVGWGISYEIALRWMPLDLTGDKSKLVQVMAWCLQATSHYLSQCWPRSLSPYDVNRPQWVKKINIVMALRYSCDTKSMSRIKTFVFVRRPDMLLL